MALPFAPAGAAKAHSRRKSLARPAEKFVLCCEVAPPLVAIEPVLVALEVYFFGISRGHWVFCEELQLCSRIAVIIKEVLFIN